MSARPRLLHLVSARGGGMCRFARDLLAPGDAMLHAGEELWVLETRDGDAAPRFRAYRVPADSAADWLDDLLAAHALDALHAHFLAAPTLPLLESWSERGRTWLASLHDVGFLRADAFAATAALPVADAAWVARWRAVLQRAAVLTAPSAFLAQEFAHACPGLGARIVAPGIQLPEAPPARAPGSLRSVAVVGALGGHKGKQRLLSWLAHADATRWRWTLVGYTEDQLQPGWIADGRMQVHGPFEAADTVRWLGHYAVDLVLFPNLLAESFSYALSDVWAAGVPVLVPDCGALAERVRKHGGGGLLVDPDDPAALIAQLDALADGGQLAAWRAQIECGWAHMVPTIAGMRKQMDEVLERLPRVRADVDADAARERLQAWLASQLDEVVFRHENIRLARDYAQVRAWADKLEADVDRQARDLIEHSRLRTELELRLGERDEAIAGLRARNARVEADAAALLARNAQVEADAARLALAARESRVAQAAQAQQLAELSARATDLSTRLVAEQQRGCGLSRRCTDLTGELSAMHQRMNALEEELRPLRTKGARYDRVLSWLPAPLLACARGWLQMRRLRVAR
ncbi:MAG: glycosyltransferase [Xanthomonadales bacterium PRO6]|nr:hypothetical protein [Xanthomonadales bacterium]MCE7930019.1 glycosyltransferase [Xanthomonadales bacterium PRO6]